MIASRLAQPLLMALGPALCGVLFMACGSDDAVMPTAVDAEAVTRDYHQDAKAVLDRYCTNCHQAGGIAPFTLTDYTAAKNNAAVIKTAVQSGTMPPWLPADDSLPLRYSRKMADGDKQILLDWISSGTLEGDPSAPSRVTIPPAEEPVAPRHDLTLAMGEAYTPNQQLSDDYRCFIIDPGAGGTGGLLQDSYLQAGTILPGTPTTVHHVIIFEIGASDADAARQLDENEAGPGYTCFGGPGVGTTSLNGTQMVMGWAPGGTVMRLNADEAVPMSKGSIFVMQVHYNLANFTGQADLSKAYLELSPTPTPYQVRLLPVANPSGLKIMAGDKDAVQTILLPVALILKYINQPTLTIISAAPHMHVLGTQITTSIDSQSLVDIPKWNFHWQQSYLFNEPYIAQPNENIIVECHYDNSQANQPIDKGVQQPPHDVTWGEDTRDEMCLSFLGIRYPMMNPGM